MAAAKRNTAVSMSPEAKSLAAAGEEHAARLTQAKQQKSHSQADIEECYYFMAPRRARSASSGSSSTSRSTDANELQTSLGFEMAEDFVTMIIDSFMPQAGRWAERLADPSLLPAQKKGIEDKVRAEDEKIFQTIRSSNFHAELAKQGVPDGAIGVFAMDIQPGKRGNPPACIGVPVRELEINLGPDGRVDDRFVVKRTHYRHIPGLLRGVTLPDEVKKLVKDKPNEPVTCEWGYWRNWERDDNEVWSRCIRVGSTTIEKGEHVGVGSCPLVVGRFGATPDYAWPDGPSIKALPDYRQIDEMRAAFIENIDFTLRPPKAYDDDSVLGSHISDGVEPGALYPRRPGGTRNSFENIYEPPQLDAALFEVTQLERRVRRLHYVDFPEQLGKTPPTLGQWLDEMVEAQKKIGTPGYAFWREFPFEAFCRFTYLAEAAGLVVSLEKLGLPAGVQLHAYNPAQRAQENQEVLTATRLIQIGGQAFPQTWQLAVDEMATIKNIQDKLGDKLVVMRDPSQLEGAAERISQLGGVFGPRLSGGLSGAAGGG